MTREINRNRETNHVVCIMNNYKLTVFDLSGGGGGGGAGGGDS